jgi:hypothetical protein
MPASGFVVTLHCDRRGHLLGRSYPTSWGPLIMVLYDSGRPTRRMQDGEVLRTLQYQDARGFLLRGGLSGSEARCDCTTVALDARGREYLATVTESAAQLAKPRGVSLPSSLCNLG